MLSIFQRHMPSLFISSYTLGLDCIDRFPPFLESNRLKLETSSLCRFCPENSYPIGKTNFHNYSPRPDRDFVLNICSRDEHVLEKSINHVRSTLELSSTYGSSHYGLHAGFAIDIQPSMLGTELQGQVYTSRDIVFNEFCATSKDLGKFAQERNVRLLIENNVLGAKNASKRLGPALLCVTSSEIISFLESVTPYCGLLLDVAHLAVSCKSLGLDLLSEMTSLLPYVEGLHLSVNDLTEDTNDPFGGDAWFLPYIAKMERLALVTIETRPCPEEKILDMVHLVQDKVAA